jgi:hypothetical protein
LGGGGRIGNVIVVSAPAFWGRSDGVLLGTLGTILAATLLLDQIKIGIFQQTATRIAAHQGIGALYFPFSQPPLQESFQVMYMRFTPARTLR